MRASRDSFRWLVLGLVSVVSRGSAAEVPTCASPQMPKNVTHMLSRNTL